jgi:hypothetical protein
VRARGSGGGVALARADVGACTGGTFVASGLVSCALGIGIAWALAGGVATFAGGAGGSSRPNESAKGSPRLSGWLPLGGSWDCVKDSSRARPRGGVLLGERSDEDVGRLGPKEDVLATGKSPGRGTPSRSVGRSPGRGAASRSTGRSLGRGTASRSMGRSPGRGTASRSMGRSLGRGTASRSIGRSPGRGTASLETGKSEGRGTASRAAGRSVGRGTVSREAGRSSEEGRAGGLTRKAVLQNKQTWSMPPLGMSTTTCCPLKHFGQMTLSEATAMPFKSFYHRRAFIAQCRLWVCPGSLAESPRAGARCAAGSVSGTTARGSKRGS